MQNYPVQNSKSRITKSVLMVLAKNKMYIIGGLPDVSYTFGPVTQELSELTKIKSAQLPLWNVYDDKLMHHKFRVLRMDTVVDIL